MPRHRDARTWPVWRAHICRRPLEGSWVADRMMRDAPGEFLWRGMISKRRSAAAVRASARLHQLRAARKWPATWKGVERLPSPGGG